MSLQVNRNWSVISLVVLSAGCFINRSNYRSSQELGSDVPEVDTPDPMTMDVPDLDTPDPIDVPTGADAADVPTGRDAVDVVLPAIVAPRLIAPLSGTRVNSRTITFTFDGQAEHPARIEVSQSRMFPVMGTDRMIAGPGAARKTATVTIPSNNDGVAFFRACAGLTECSPTWSLQVTRGGDPAGPARTTGMGITGNILGGNGANRTAEVGLSARTDVWHMGMLYLYETPTLAMRSPPVSIWRECVEGLGGDIANCGAINDSGALLSQEVTMLGDTNGDGRGEIGMFGIQGAGNPGRIVILTTQPRNLLSLGSVQGMPTPGRQMIRNLTGVGDFNGDGLDDISVVANSGGSQSVDVYLAALPMVPTGNPFAIARRVTLTGDSLNGLSAASFGNRITRAGDINGDGYADIAVALPQQGPNGEVWIYYGRSTFPMSGVLQPDVRISSTPAYPGIGNTIAGGGDLDGDQYADLMVTYVDGAMQGFLYVKGGPMPSLRVDSAIRGLLNIDALGPMGDIDGDGRGDVIAYNSRPGAPIQMAVLFVQQDAMMMMGMPPTVGNRVLQDIPENQNITDISIPGDLDGDSIDDLVINVTNGGTRFLRWNAGMGRFVDAFPMGGVAPPIAPITAFGNQIASLDFHRFNARSRNAFNLWSPPRYAQALLTSIN